MIRVLVKNPSDRTNLQLYYVNPLTGVVETRSARTADPREAQREAARWEAELVAGTSPSATTWEAFRMRFETEHLAALSRKTQMSYATALNWFEELVGSPRAMSAIDASVVSRFKGRLRGVVDSEHSVATYLGHLRGALRWAASVGMLRVAPTFKLPQLPKRRLVRGRSLTDDEYSRMCDAMPLVVGETLAPEWVRTIRGMWLSGLRLDEILRLDWTTAPARVDLDAGPFPRIVWFGEGQKSRRDEATPITPDFAEFLRQTPSSNRVGRVFAPKHPSRRVTTTVASRAISAVGKHANVTVNDRGKFASAHDLRRSFGTRWAVRVRPITLQALMRHASIETTLKFYVDLHCDDVGAELWGLKIGESVTNFVTKSASESA
jgi:integrase